MKTKTFDRKVFLTKTTVSNLSINAMEAIQGGDPILTKNPKKCETLDVACQETNPLVCHQTGVTCA